MQVDYNWLPVQTNHFGLIFRPMALVSLKHARAEDAWLTRLFLVDSGADITVMNKSDAVDLGIDFEAESTVPLGQATGDVCNASYL